MFPRPSRVTRLSILIAFVFCFALFCYVITPGVIDSPDRRGFESMRFTTRSFGDSFEGQGVSKKEKGTLGVSKHPVPERLRSVNPHDFRYIHNPSGLCQGSEHYQQNTAGGNSPSQTADSSRARYTDHIRRRNLPSKADESAGEGLDDEDKLTLAEKTRRAVTLLVYIHSAPGNLKKRQAVRQTWAHPKLLRRLDAAAVFLLGRPRATKEQAMVDLEASEYGDLVQEDFLDAYRNLTYKGVAGLRWASMFCPSAVFLLKTDDDILVDIVSLVSDLRQRYPTYPSARPGSGSPGLSRGIKPAAQQSAPPKGVVLCNLWTRMKVMRDPKSKWFIPPSEFAPDYFPPYCSGSAFILSADMAPRLYSASLDAPFFWVDDYYVTGVLVNTLRIPHVRYNHAYLLNSNLAEARLANDSGKTLIFHVKKLPLFLKLWPLLLRRHLAISEVQELMPTTHATPRSIIGAAPGDRDWGRDPQKAVISPKLLSSQKAVISPKVLSEYRQTRVTFLNPGQNLSGEKYQQQADISKGDLLKPRQGHGIPELHFKNRKVLEFDSSVSEHHNIQQFAPVHGSVSAKGHISGEKDKLVKSSYDLPPEEWPKFHNVIAKRGTLGIFAGKDELKTVMSDTGEYTNSFKIKSKEVEPTIHSKISALSSSAIGYDNVLKVAAGAGNLLQTGKHIQGILKQAVLLHNNKEEQKEREAIRGLSR